MQNHLLYFIIYITFKVQNMKIINRITILLFLFTSQSFASDITEIKIESLKTFYKVGEVLSIDLIEKVKTNHLNKVDLWLAIQIPSKKILFKTPLLLAPFSLKPQAFKTSVQNSGINLKLLEFEVPPGFGGDYIFYAFYVKAGTSPIKDGFIVQRSNLSMKKTTLANQ